MIILFFLLLEVKNQAISTPLSFQEEQCLEHYAKTIFKIKALHQGVFDESLDWSDLDRCSWKECLELEEALNLWIKSKKHQRFYARVLQINLKEALKQRKSLEKMAKQYQANKRLLNSTKPSIRELKQATQKTFQLHITPQLADQIELLNEKLLLIENQKNNLSSLLDEQTTQNLTVEFICETSPIHQWDLFDLRTNLYKSIKLQRKLTELSKIHLLKKHIVYMKVLLIQFYEQALQQLISHQSLSFPRNLEIICRYLKIDQEKPLELIFPDTLQQLIYQLTAHESFEHIHR